MIKYFLIALGILFCLPSLAQEKHFLNGRVVADSLQGSAVHIINITRKTGTVNNSNGNFEINVAENDTILFSSIQYVNINIPVTAEILKGGYLIVELTEDINELSEVNISNTTLTGNIKTDLENIKIVKNLPFTFDLGPVQIDPPRAPENLAFKENQINTGAGTLNIIGGIEMLADLFGDKDKPKKKNKAPVVPPGPVSEQLGNRFNDDFFKSSLGIKEENIKDFLYYLDDQKIDSQLLNERNSLALIELLFLHSKAYNKIREGN